MERSILSPWIGSSHYYDGTGTPEQLIESAAKLRPSKEAAAWQCSGFSVFVHFGMNTFTGAEWGDGTTSPEAFRPDRLDADQWAQTVKAAGAEELILTCKHHDGFCLWPSRLTDYSVKSSLWRDGQGDVVREVSDACRRAGIKFGIYCSPWDRHEKGYGTPTYNDFYKAQLTELLTSYGEIAELWLDGACGEGENGKKQEYDWAGYWSLAKELQPGIVITGMGPDARWCGNEDGICRPQEWAQTFISDTAPADWNEDRRYAYSVVQHNQSNECCREDLFTQSALEQYAAMRGWLMWYPPMVDTSIRPGWFYHAAEDQKVRSVENLVDLYHRSAGGNAMLLLNIPPNQDGLFHQTDIEHLKALGRHLRETFSHNLIREVQRDGMVWTAHFSEPGDINLIELKEALEDGQAAARCIVEVERDGTFEKATDLSTIGARKLLRIPNVHTQRIRVTVLQARGPVSLNLAGAYLEPPLG